MKTFEFEIQEFLSRNIEIEAKNEEEAFFKVKEMYKKEQIILDSSDYVDTKIIKKTSIENEYEKDKLISEIVDYLYLDEEKYFEECEKPLDHIFLKLEKIKNLI